MWSAVALQVTEPSSEVPDHIRPNHLIKELTKEIRHLEVRTWDTVREGLLTSENQFSRAYLNTICTKVNEKHLVMLWHVVKYSQYSERSTYRR